ncbi:uncharacterized protein TrAFT101_005243 [Trichoderma asperellum]|uniref:uncharacterized protein n=1 Tax=Trichoderma asperellum TaxID=101201 RepID=UPI00331F116D|nr:hypothetical protein TrAFT101_005243 [Trichoderma asperellum]
MPQSPLSAKLNLQGTRSYPPCLFNTQAEQDLYKRLRDVYEEHCHTWDAEALDAWPVIVEHASLAPSTIGKITNHYITRHMVTNGVTWAHVVALRIIYDKQLYKSKKITRLVRDRYPNASFESFGYSEDYTLSFKSENARAREAQEPAVPKSPAEEDSLQRHQGNGGLPLTKTPPNNHREMSTGTVEFLSEGNSSDDELIKWRSSKRKKRRPTRHAASRKQATANNIPKAAGVDPRDRRSKRPRHAARDTLGESPRSGEVGERPNEKQDDTVDILEKFMSAINENTKAVKENTRATEENTRAMKEMRERNKAALRKATKN